MSELNHYDYELPRELVAEEPLVRRADARLLVVDRASGTIDHRHIRDLPELLRAGDCLVLNNTRVLPAQLRGFRVATGGRWQGLFLAADAAGNWRVLCKTRGHLRPGELVTLIDREAREALQLRMLLKESGGEWLARPESEQATPELLERVGRVPLPHYIRGGRMVESDLVCYQTVFAQEPGAVAAPTAGLHFTPELLARLEKKGVGRVEVTLHVGLGTFRPITATSLSEHQMHSEWARLTAQAATLVRSYRAAGGRIVAVGTTSVRTLESAAASGSIEAFEKSTNLFIRPPYEFRAVDALLTNFHLPRTTLLVLVRTFGGDALICRAYQEAMDQRYRFYSYGDAMLIL